MRGAPWGAAGDPPLDTVKTCKLATVFGRLEHAIAECRLVVQPAFVTVKIGSCHLREWPVHTPGTGKENAAINQRQHRERDIADPGDREIISTARELDP